MCCFLRVGVWESFFGGGENGLGFCLICGIFLRRKREGIFDIIDCK